MKPEDSARMVSRQGHAERQGGEGPGIPQQQSISQRGSQPPGSSSSPPPAPMGPAGLCPLSGTSEEPPRGLAAQPAPHTATTRASGAAVMGPGKWLLPLIRGLKIAKWSPHAKETFDFYSVLRHLPLDTMFLCRGSISSC